MNSDLNKFFASHQIDNDDTDQYNNDDMDQYNVLPGIPIPANDDNDDGTEEKDESPRQKKKSRSATQPRPSSPSPIYGGFDLVCNNIKCSIFWTFPSSLTSLS